MSLHGEGGEIDLLARGFESLDTSLDAVCRVLRNLELADTGPQTSAAAFERATIRLEASLSASATTAREAAQVVRRYADDEAAP